MKKIMSLILIAGSILSTGMLAQSRSTSKSLETFPPMMNNLERHRIFLEQKENENDYKVELAGGMIKGVDCNSHGLIGNFEEKELKELGFSFYVYHTEGHTLSTSKGCLEPKRIILVMGSNKTIDYNSKHPLVVYAPKGVEIKYRIIKIDKEEE